MSQVEKVHLVKTIDSRGKTLGYRTVIDSSYKQFIALEGYQLLDYLNNVADPITGRLAVLVTALELFGIITPELREYVYDDVDEFTLS